MILDQSEILPFFISFDPYLPHEYYESTINRDDTQNHIIYMIFCRHKNPIRFLTHTELDD
jgi:hypothetical protein